MKVFQVMVTHPRVLLVNQLQSKSGINLGQAQYLYSLPEGQISRHLQEDQNNKGSFQKWHWYSRASSGKIR